MHVKITIMLTITKATVMSLSIINQALVALLTAGVQIMQALRTLHSRLALVEKGACSVTSQLPELRRWQATVVSILSARNVIHAGAVPSRTFAAMPLSTGKQRIVILGTGWAAARLTMDLDCKYHDVTVRSIRRQDASMTSIYATRFTFVCHHDRWCHPETIWFLLRCSLQHVLGLWSSGV